MKTYLKKFSNHSNYEAFKDGVEFVTPNVSVCVNENEVHFNPLVHEYVDLGLPSGTLWATESIKDENGNNLYFAWGETRGYKDDEIGQDKRIFNWRDYKFTASLDESGVNPSFSKYGTIDNKRFLDSEDDAATANWGTSWKLPSESQFQELIDNTTFSYNSQTNSVKFTSTINGNELIIDCLGRYGMSTTGTGFMNDKYVILMGNELYNEINAWDTSALSAKAYMGGSELNRVAASARHFGLQVRPVRVETNSK